MAWVAHWGLGFLTTGLGSVEGELIPRAGIRPLVDTASLSLKV